ncbi:MAG: T9SS type A sorting domain-containing protein [Bacteroidia bacterium]
MKKRKGMISVLLAFIFSITSFAQSTWYFGNKAGLKFPGGGMTPSYLAGSPIYTGEGSGALVDEFNNVIMYTDGKTIWNGAHATQPTSGTAYVLEGHSSSTESALLVPIPGTNGTKAFVFTVNAAETSYGNWTRAADQVYGLRVSLATIAGVAPNCNITILPTEINKRITPTNILTSERLSVTPDGRGGYWVLTHGVNAFTSNPSSGGSAISPSNGGNTFYAYHVTCATTSIGLLDATEVLSTFSGGPFTEHRSWNHSSAGAPFDLGSLVQTVGSAQAQINSQGQLKFSSDGKKVACTLPWTGNVEGTSGWLVSPKCQLFDFNLTTGVLGGTHALEFNLTFINADNNTKDGSAGGLEFSPNGDYLYVSSTVGSGRLVIGNDGVTATAMTSRVYRYPISTWVPGPKQTVATLPFSNQPGFGYLQLGPDDRIYIARPNKNYIDVIRDPNNTTLAFVDYQTFPSPNCPTYGGIAYCMSGLPTTVLVSRKAYVPLLTTYNSCQGNPITVFGTYTGEAPSDTYWEIVECDGSGNTVAGGYNWNQWYPGPPSTFTFPGSGTLACNKYYRIKLALGNGCGGGWQETSRVIYVACNPTPIITGNSTICYGSSTTLCVNYAPGHGTSVIWNNGGFGTQCITVTPTSTTIYTVSVIQNGCVGTAYYTVNVLCNNPDFGVTTSLPYTGSPNFTCFATPLATPCTGLAAYWEVSEINSSGAIVPGTTVSGPPCWNTGSTPFYRYTGSSALVLPCNSSSPIGLFPVSKIYRITHGSAILPEVCPWATVTATVSVGGGGRLASQNVDVVKSGFEYMSPEQVTRIPKTGAQDMLPLVSIFPNPSKGIITINANDNSKKDLFVYDVVGKIVYSKKQVEDKETKIDLSELPAGIYSIKVMSEGTIYTEKLIKE